MSHHLNELVLTKGGDERATMIKYSDEFKAKVVAHMYPPYNQSINEIIKETGVAKVTLYAWKYRYRGVKEVVDAKKPGADVFSSAEKFHLVVESAALNEQELGEFCRRRGLFPEQLARWREACLVANESRPKRDDRGEQKELVKQIRSLEDELHRKEKALAETAALLVLQKKVHSILGGNGDARSNCRSGTQ